MLRPEFREQHRGPAEEEEGDKENPVL